MSIVTLRCKYLEVAKKVIANVLGEEYIEPGIEGLPERPRQWWQRSIDSGMGGRGSRDLGMIKKPRVTVIGGCSFVKNNT